MLQSETIENSHELRDMKIKMDKQNMKYIFDNDKNVGDYLYSKISSFNTNFYEDIHLKIIEYLMDKKIPVESIFEKVEKHYKRYNIDVTYELFCNIIIMIIDDYNNYYLNDDYYYGGYWYDSNWCKYEEEN